MVRKDEHAHVREATADLLCGEEAVIELVGRHTDVDDGDIRSTCFHHAQQRVRVTAESCDLEPGVLEQAAEALPQEHLVVGDHKPHGNSARTWVASPTTVPPTAPTRSSTRRGRGANLRAPVSSMISRPSRSLASTLTSPAEASRSTSPMRKYAADSTGGAQRSSGSTTGTSLGWASARASIAAVSPSSSSAAGNSPWASSRSASRAACSSSSPAASSPSSAGSAT